MYCRTAPTLLLASCLASGLAAQKVAIQAPVGGAIVPGTAAEKGGETDEGTAVELFESPNLDRYLRRAQDCLSREDYPQAIKILQDVIEGRTLEAQDTSGKQPEQAGTTEKPPEPKDGTKAEEKPAPKPDAKPDAKADPKPGAKEANKAKKQVIAGAGLRVRNGAFESDDAPAAAQVKRPDLADPANSVFSAGGRLYRPVRRLCQELLAGLPPAALVLYRTQYDVEAQEALDQAERDGSTALFERVVNRWFATLAAGKAMQALADRCMQSGRYRSAVQVLRDLADLYPKSNLKELGIDPLWCRFKIALCLRLADEQGAASDEAKAIAGAYPDESLRVMGELQPMRTLAESSMFRAGDQTLVSSAAGPSVRVDALLDPTKQGLVPLWQHRSKRNPYAPPPPSKDNDRNNFFFSGEGAVSIVAPPATEYGTGTSVAFLGGSSSPDRAVFLDGNRMRVADAFTGVLLAQGDKSEEILLAQENKPRPRVPVYDLALQRPLEDEARYYVIAGFPKPAQTAEPLKENELLAYDKKTGDRLWSSNDFHEGEAGYQEVTFLAAPTLSGERLLAPVLREGAYALQCIERTTGKPIWCTKLHAGGTPYFKAPGTKVELIGGTAYVLTNAGVLAAVDTFAGELRWLRRYERRHPLREPAKIKKPAQRGGVGFFGSAAQFTEQQLPSFLPSDLLVAGGTLVFAPCDGNVLLCVDGASGEPVWMIEAESKHAPFGRIRYLVGANSRNLYAATENDLICIGLQSGIVRWSLKLPKASPQSTKWRGRGVVLENQVLMPGDREILVVDAENEGQRGWQNVALPSFDLSEPLHGPCNLFVSGPWLGVSYPEGVEVYSTAAALQQLAAREADVRRKAVMLVQSGERDAAIEALAGWLGGEVADADAREIATQQLIALAREGAMQKSATDFAALDRVLPFAKTRSARMLWHLARMDVCRMRDDLRAYEQEQERLYRFMEGKD